MIGKYYCPLFERIDYEGYKLTMRYPLRGGYNVMAHQLLMTFRKHKNSISILDSFPKRYADD